MQSFSTDQYAVAAFSLCEAILNALVEKGIMTDAEVDQLLSEKADAWLDKMDEARNKEFQAQVAALLEAIRKTSR